MKEKKKKKHLRTLRFNSHRGSANFSFFIFACEYFFYFCITTETKGNSKNILLKKKDHLWEQLNVLVF